MHNKKCQLSLVMKYISFKQPYAELLVAGRKIGDKAILPGRETISSMQHSIF